MDILLYSPEDQDALASGLAKAFPEAGVHVWREPGSGNLDLPGTVTAGLAGASGKTIAPPPCDYAVLWAPPAQLFDGQDKLKAIFSLGAGVDSLLRCPSLPKNVPVIRIEDAGMADQMAEYAMYAAIQRLRHFDQYRSFSSAGLWRPLSYTARKNLRVGVLGLGELGRKVAHTLASFGFSVSAWSRTEKQVEGINCHHGEAGLNAVLASSDVLVVLLPLTGATRGLLNLRRLSILPKDSCVVNLARGPIVNDDDLLALLETGHLGYAFLDVFNIEPLPPDHPYWNNPRVCVTPHIAAVIPPAESVAQISMKIRALEAGQSTSGIVDLATGY